MKSKSVLSLAAILFAGTLLAQTSGGPDAYGYTWKNQAEPTNPPVYNWKDIKATGTQITGLQDDNQKGPYTIGWNFHYYWANFNKIWVGSNGWISFQNNSVLPAAPFPVIPTATAPNNYLAGMSCDLTFIQTNLAAVPGATAWYWSNLTDSLIVQYDSVPYWVTGGAGFSGRYTFQIILSGADSSITYQYKLAQTGTTAYAMASEGLTVGIENSTGQIGLQPMQGVFPVANTAIKYYYPNPVTYQVFDATPSWNQNIDNGGFFVSANGSPLSLETDVFNAGNQPLSNINTTGVLLDNTSTQVWDTTVKVSSLTAGADSMFVFPKTYNPVSKGTFTYRTTTTATGDINPANNVTDVEMVVVDTTLQVIPLSYVTGTTAGTQNAWGGNGGQGIFIEPPFYPAMLISADFLVTNSGTSGYHIINVLDDDGPGNTPGTVLYVDSVAASAAQIGSWNNVPIVDSLVITSGGVYIGWLENGDSLSAIGTESTPPLSNRNYEIIGAWSNYRNNSVDDIMIQANICQYKFGTLTVNATTDACPSNASASATVAVTAGTSPPFTYAWSNGQTTAVATGLAAGTYTCTVTDSIGISKDVIVQVYNNVTVTAATTQSVTCFGSSNGASTATITGTTPYTYLWSNGQTDQVATGLAVGVYTVTATNGDGCMNMAVDTISGPTALASTFTVTPATCSGGNGTASANVSGGTTPYTFLWSNSQATATATGLSAGTYSVLITDANGCTKSGSATVTLVPFNSSTASTPTKCAGTTDGVATSVVSSGGTPPYTYAWSSGQTTQIASGLAAGTYTVVTTDAVGCSTTKTVTVTSPAPLVVTASSQPATWPNFNNGTATGNVTGGTAPFTYVWSNGVTAQTITGLSSGNYTVCVTDINGCSGGCDTVNVTLNGVNEIYSGASITISPNPFNTAAYVNIDFVNPGHTGLVFRIFDIYGKQIESVGLNNTNSPNIGFNLNRGYNIPAGVYFYRLEDDKEILSAGKLLVQ